MKKSKTLVFLMLTWFPFLQTVSAETGALWAKSTVTGPSNSTFYSVATANDSTIYAAGKIATYGVYNFGNRITASGDYFSGDNIILVKYNSSGSAEWARTTIEATNKSVFRGVAVDNSKNSSYVVGSFDGTSVYDFGNTVRINGNFTGTNPLLINYDNAGNAKWVQSTEMGFENAEFNSVATDHNGTIYASGWLTGTGVFDFGNGVTANGSSTTVNPVLLKYNSTGSAIWTKSTLSGSSTTIFQAVATDNNGNIYATGFINNNGTYDFGNGITISGSAFGDNLVLVKYDSSGNAQWAKSTINSSGSSYAYHVAVDNSDNIYIAGLINQNTTFDFGNGVQINGSYSGDNVILIKYDNNGNAQWAKTTISSIEPSIFTSVAIDTDGNIYATGKIRGSEYFDFGNGVTATGSYDNDWNPVLVKYDSSGNALMAESTTASYDKAEFNGVTTDTKGGIYAAGINHGDNTFNFGNGVATNGGYTGSNVILVKYGTIVPAPSSSSAHTSNSSSSSPPVASAGTKNTAVKLATWLSIATAFVANI